MIPASFRAMSAYQQFILWREVPSKKVPGRMEKLPCDHTGAVISAHDSTQWMSAAHAYQIAAQTGYKVGFVFTEHDPFWFLDIDHCKEANGNWSALAQQLVATFPGAAVEVSHSGEGLHIFGCGSHAAPDDHRCKNQGLGLEFYTKERFVAFGMHGGETGDAGADHSGMVVPFLTHYMPGESGADLSEGWTAAPVPEWNGPVEDGELLQKMLAAQGGSGAVFGPKASIADLWYKREDALARAYPHPDGSQPFDHSSADAALLSHLAFWTGKDCERMDRLFRQSALMRDKWANRQDYRFRSVVGATSRCNEVYSKGKKKDEAPPESVEPQGTMVQGSQLRMGYQYLGIEQQQQHFAGCVYVSDLHRVFVPSGDLLKPDTFKAIYGGYSFQMDTTGDKTTRNAFEVFTESHGWHFPKAHGVCFRPETGSGNLLEENGRILVNQYVPITTPISDESPEPFLDLLRRLLPDENDRAILLAYVAAVVQYPGVKFQWAPLIQGVEGNGKSLIISAVAACVGDKYFHPPNATDLAGNGAKFNSWLAGKLFIGVEEIYVADRREVEDALKPMITNRKIEMQGKGADQVTMDNRANFILNTNHRDAILKKKNDRRYCLLFTAQQEVEHLARDGMTGDYFPSLYRWFHSGGAAAINGYLRSYQIPDELNPATSCHRAPYTSVTEEAIACAVGPVEQEILEAIEEGRLGFCGGFVSSIWLDKMIKDGRIRKLSQQKRKEALQAIGYIPHPALKEGRANNPVTIDGGKPRIYVKKDHPAASIGTAKGVVDAYVNAQNSAGLDNSHAAAVFSAKKH